MNSERGIRIAFVLTATCGMQTAAMRAAMDGATRSAGRFLAQTATLKRTPIITATEELVALCLGMASEIDRLREGLLRIECEPINAEYMARDALDGRKP